MGLIRPALVCGNRRNTTLSLGLLIYSGVVDRFPNLNSARVTAADFFPYSLEPFRSRIRHPAKQATGAPTVQFATLHIRAGCLPQGTCTS